MIQVIYRMLIELTNGRWSSRAIQRFATSKLSRFLIPSYSKIFRINQQEMVQPLKNYQTLHELFIRNLKEDARQFDHEKNSVISPVDAVIEAFGQVTNSKQITVKGKMYSISEMLGNDNHLKKYLNGTFIIFYLSPSDYHRIHSPISGQVTDEWTLGEKSYPVNKYGLKYGKNPLSKNYRTITEVQHMSGHIAIVKVGAMFVNSIEKTYEGDKLFKGKEMAYFTFGSTVILLFEENTFEMLQTIKAGMDVKVGKKIGKINRNIKT